MLLLRTLAVNDRTRLKMLKLLADRSYSTNEMAERLNMNASTASGILKFLKSLRMQGLLIFAVRKEISYIIPLILE